MYHAKNILTTLVIVFPLCLFSQTKTLEQSPKLAKKFIAEVDKKTDKYYNRITDKTEKTLERLSKWEIKIKKLLESANPDAAKRLFANEKLTFAYALQQYKQGKAASDDYRQRYNSYRDNLNTTIKYVEQNVNKIDSGLTNPAKQVSAKLNQLEEQVKNTEAIERFIKERKQQLISESIKYIGNSKYLKNISKESYYYVETLKNYKEIFSNEKKAEEAAMKLLNEIPAFKNFVRNNSMLASLFGGPVSTDPAQSLAGLQTRADVNNMIQGRIAAGGPNAMQQVSQNMQEAQAQLQTLKNQMNKYGANSSDELNMPDFKPNQQKSKTFLQRLEFGTNIQTQKPNGYFPVTSDIALSMGYKLNDKSVIGVGSSFKMGWGQNFSNMRISAQGVGLRSFLDYKIKGTFWLTGGFEMNYQSEINNLEQLKSLNAWQQSGLIGITKNISIKTKFFKKTKIQLLYDFLASKQIPANQPILFRVGYNF